MKSEPDTTFKRLLKGWGVKLTQEQVEALALAAADVYAHGTEDGWCCACSADIAFADSWLRESHPELFECNRQHVTKLDRNAGLPE